MGTGGEDLQAYNGTIALLARHAGTIRFADMVSHTFRIADAALAIETSLDAGTATKVLISNTLGPARASAHTPVRWHAQRSLTRDAKSLPRAAQALSGVAG